MTALGVRLPSTSTEVGVRDIRRLAVEADRMGYDSLWVPDHVLVPTRIDTAHPYHSTQRWDADDLPLYLDPIVTLAWIAEAAPSMRLGTSIMVLALRNPVLVAKQLSTLAHLTGGRAVLGVGVGWLREEFALVGASFDERGVRVDESIRQMRQMWSGEVTAMEVDGDVYEAVLEPTPPGGHIPIMIGGNGPRSVRRAASVDGWIPSGLSFDQLESSMRQLDDHCNESGRDRSEVQIVVKPNRPTLTPAAYERYVDLGVDTVIIDPPSGAPVDEFIRNLERLTTEIQQSDPR